MPKSVAAIKTALFALAQSSGICDPLTGCFPTSERALSGLLCLYAQRGAIRWDEVPLYDVQTFGTKGQAIELISQPGSFVTEYVLLHHDKSEEEVWGGIPADLLYVSSDLNSIILFENKIGASLEYDPTPESNQLARQLDYLVRLHDLFNRKVSLVLISSKELFERGWYRREFLGALEHNNRSSKAAGYLMIWEDIFCALS